MDHGTILDLAMQEAEGANADGTEPVGSVFVSASGNVIAVGRNRVHSRGDATAHAEVDAIRAAGRAAIGPPAGSVLYTTAEPCMMCFGAILVSSVSEVVWALDWVRDSAHASAVTGGYESERVRGLRVIREPSKRHRDESRRILAAYYRRTGQEDLSGLLTSEDA